MERERELFHHGILGMKWGVRRYQNPDGTLTAKGKARYIEVESSELKSKIDTMNAKGLHKRKAKMFSNEAVGYDNQAKKYEKKANKYLEGTYEHDKYMSKSKENREKSKASEAAAKLSLKKLKDIESGKLKAGRDFIIQYDTNINLTKIPFYVSLARDMHNPNKETDISYFGYNERTYLERKKKK